MSDGGFAIARAHPRVAVRLPVRLADDIGGFEECVTRDVSIGGAFILGPRPRPVGHIFDAFLCLPDGSSEIGTHSEVRWQSEDGWGTRFLMVEPRQREELRQFIGSLLEAQEFDDRKHPRVRVQMLINLKVEGVFLRALADNISRGGAYLEVKRDLKIGDQLEMLLVHPILETGINLNGEVVRVERLQDAARSKLSCGVGVQFKDLDPVRAKELETLLRRLLDYEQRGATRS
jgi:Tfp pilus assembly protein PilZ